MELVTRTIKVVFGVVGFVATYLPIVLDMSGTDMWGLSWQWWTLIGATMLCFSGAWIIWDLYSEKKKSESEDAKLTREERKLNIKNGLLSYWQTRMNMESLLPENLKKKLDDLE